MLADTHEFILFLASITLFLLAMETGFRFGLKHTGRNNEGNREHIRVLVTALFGLLALLLGFSFAMASSRLEARKAVLQSEVNAIGTTWLRTQLLPDKWRNEVSQFIKAYVDARIQYIASEDDIAQARSANEKASEAYEQLWRTTRSIVNEGPVGPQTSLFIQSLNDMGNIKWLRYAALDNHVPEPVLHLLLIVAMGAIGFVSYMNGLTGHRRHGSTFIIAFLIGVVLLIILDFDRPRMGFVRIDEESMLRLQSSLAFSTQ